MVGPMLLRPGIFDVFKKYSQKKLAMKRESLHQPIRKANEVPVDPPQTIPGNLLFGHSLGTAMTEKSRNGFRRARKCFGMDIFYRYCGRGAQLGEHLLCKRVRALQRLHPLPSVFNFFNNFWESASRSK
jgi:hypothetical protein